MFPVNTQLETIVVESLDGVPERYSATRGKKKNTKKTNNTVYLFCTKSFARFALNFSVCLPCESVFTMSGNAALRFPSWLFMTGDLQIYLEAQHAIAMLYTTTTIYIKVVY